MRCPNKVIHVTYGAPLFLRQRTYEGEWERWEGSRVKRPGWLWFRCNRTGQLRVGYHLTVKAFEYEGMERLANLRSNWIKEGPEVNVVLSHPVYHIQYSTAICCTVRTQFPQGDPGRSVVISS